MAASAKSLSLSAELADALTQQGFTISQSFDSDGAPLIRVGSNAAAGQQTALIKIKQIDLLGSDSVGLSARGYAPHVLQLVLETSATANLALMTEANEFLLIPTCAFRGIKMELYMSANNNATGPEDITSGNLKQTWNPSPKYQTLMSQ